MRKPIIVAIANFILPGLGYLLLGQRVKFGSIVLLACIIQILQLIIDPLPPYYIVYGSFPLSVALGISVLVIGLFTFGYDAYVLAKKSAREIT